MSNGNSWFCYMLNMQLTYMYRSYFTVMFATEDKTLAVCYDIWILGFVCRKKNIEFYIGGAMSHHWSW